MTIPNGKRVLALDASTTAVGWCVADGDEYVCSGVFEPQDDGQWWERVRRVGEWIANTLLADSDIKVVVYELATGNRGNMRTNRLLGAVEYVARTRTADLYRAFETVTASQVKASGVNKDALWAAQAIAGKALAGDEADAIGVWRAYLEKMGWTTAKCA